MLTVRRLRFGLLALGAGVVALVPWLVPPYTSFELAYVGAYAVAILGLVILTGQNGQISLGHGAFLAAGGYVVAIAAQRLGIAYWISIPLAALLCGVLGLALGMVALRLAGVYLALATFALAVSVPPVLKRFKGLTGGVQGISLPSFAAPAFAHGLTPERWLYYLTWTVVALLFGASWLVLRGRVGRALRALRDSEVAAVSCGINPYFYKTLAFGWSAAYAGVAGAILALATAYVSPDAYAFSLSLTLVIGAVLGGLETLWGALLGGLIVEFLPLWAQRVNAAAPAVVYGIALIAVMIVWPGGIAGALGAAFGRIRRTASDKALGD